MKIAVLRYLILFVMMSSSLITSFHLDNTFFYPLLLSGPFIAGLLEGIMGNDSIHKHKRILVIVILAITSLTTAFPLIHGYSDLDPVLLYLILLFIYIVFGLLGTIVSSMLFKRCSKP